MRVVQAVGWYFPATTGGTEVYVAGLTSGLQRLGHVVDIVTPDPAIDAVQTYTHEDAAVHRFPIATPLTRDEARGHAPVRGGEWFHEWLRATRPDVVHFHTLVPGLDLTEVKAAKATGARVIATTHSSSLGYVCARGTMMRWGEALCDGLAEPRKCAACDLQKRGLPKWAARTAAAIPVLPSQVAGRLPGKIGTVMGMTSSIAFNQLRQTELIESVDRFVLLTAWAVDAVVRNGAPREKVALNRLGISGGYARKPGPSSRLTRPPVLFGYLGRFDPIKGVDDLGRAVRSLPPELSFRVDFSGPRDTPGDREVLRRLEQMLAGDARVSFGPPVPIAEVPAHLARLDVLCCPSVCLEGGPTVAIEAQAVGTPVVGTRIGGLAELVTDGLNGRLVPPGDWRALASAIAEIAGDPCGTVDMWRRSIPTARTMDEVVADYVKLYQE